MTNMKDKTAKSSLRTSVLETIDAENVCPRSRLFFVCKETLVWVFWGLSVLVGALAIAVCFFVMTHSQYALYEATHENFVTFLIGALPYIWIVLFAVMAYLAVTNLRHTKRGYRYAAWQVVASSIVLSLAGGAVLQLFGFGYAIDKKLGDEMNMYMSQEKIEKGLWQTPEDGRLIGKQVFSTSIPTSTIVFEDSLGVRWNMNVEELTKMDLELLGSQDVVRVLGTTSNATTRQFHACGAFPWMLDRPMKMHELSKERQAFVDRVYDHKDRAKDRLAKLELATFEGDQRRLQEIMGICAEIAPVRRIGASMQ